MDSVLSYVDIKGWDVVVPSNTFMATPLSVVKNGGNVVFADWTPKYGNLIVIHHSNNYFNIDR